MHWLAALLATSLFGHASRPLDLAGATSLTPDQGWRQVGFPLGESASAVAIAIDGHASLGRVEILFEDATIESHELAREHVYGRGVYALSSFAGARRVMLLRFEARARSPQTAVRAVLLDEAAGGHERLAD